MSDDVKTCLVTICAVCVLVACAPRPHQPPAQAVPQHHSSGTQLVPIEQVAPLEIESDEQAARDCRPSTVARRRFAGAVVHPCGTIQIDRSRPYAKRDVELLAIDDCVAAAITAGTPFVAEQHLVGLDSDGADGLVGVREHGELALYALGYDSDPCGGGCPEKGHTTVRRCRALVRETTTSCHELTSCFECTSPAYVENCEVGQRP